MSTPTTPETGPRPASPAELRAAPPRIYVRTFWFAMRVGVRIGGTLVIPIFVFWALMWVFGDSQSSDGPFSSLALRSWVVVSFVWALVDATRRPIVMNLITWLLVFLGVGAVMTVMAMSYNGSYALSGFGEAAREAFDLVGPGSLIPAAVGVGMGTLVRGVWHRTRSAAPPPASSAGRREPRGPARTVGLEPDLSPARAPRSAHRPAPRSRRR